MSFLGISKRGSAIESLHIWITRIEISLAPCDFAGSSDLIFDSTSSLLVVLS